MAEHCLPDNPQDAQQRLKLSKKNRNNSTSLRLSFTLHFYSRYFLNCYIFRKDIFFIFMFSKPLE